MADIEAFRIPRWFVIRDKTSKPVSYRVLPAEGESSPSRSLAKREALSKSDVARV
jgi:hypothetical protein